MKNVLQYLRHYWLKLIKCNRSKLLQRSMILQIPFLTILNVAAGNPAAYLDPTFHEIMGQLLQDVDLKRLMLPFISQAIGMSFYVFLSVTDFITGCQASYRLRTEKDWFKSEKAYKTIWKMVSTSLITFMFMLLSMFIEVAVGGTVIYWSFLFILTVVWIMANGFEFHSIGENLERMAGSKPKIFGLIDKITGALERKTIDKVNDL